VFIKQPEKEEKMKLFLKRALLNQFEKMLKKESSAYHRAEVLLVMAEGENHRESKKQLLIRARLDAAQICGDIKFIDVRNKAEIYAKIAKLSEMKEDVEVARAAAGAIENSWDKAEAFIFLYEITKDKKDLLMARETALEIEELSMRSRCFATIAEVSKEGEDLDYALKCIKECKDGTVEALTLGCIIKALAKKKYFQDAVELPNKAPFKDWQHWSWQNKNDASADIAEALASAGRLNRAREIGFTISDNDARIRAFVAIAKISGAKEDIKEAREAAGKVGGAFWQGLAFAKVALVSREMADIELAAKAAGKEEYLSNKEAMVHAILKALIEIKEFKKARTLATRFHDFEALANIFKAVA
jgi:hypothetical protein